MHHGIEIHLILARHRGPDEGPDALDDLGCTFCVVDDFFCEKANCLAVQGRFLKADLNHLGIGQNGRQRLIEFMPQ